MPYQLKKGVESFEIVDGPDAGKAFERGRSYKDVPEAYAAMFDSTDAPADQTKPAARSKAAKSKE